MNKTKILIISDSLALPRQSPESCPFDKTWPFLLRQIPFAEVVQISIGGATIKDLVKQVGYYKPFGSDIVILQAGIVDCSPRFATKLEQQIISKIPVPLIKKSILNLLNRKRVRKLRKITYTRPADFKISLQAIERKLAPSQVFAIGIIPATSEYEAILPGITMNVNLFNSIMASCYGGRFVDISPFPGHGLMSDHHHLTETGHRFIFETLKKVIPALQNKY